MGAKPPYPHARRLPTQAIHSLRAPTGRYVRSYACAARSLACLYCFVNVCDSQKALRSLACFLGFVFVLASLCVYQRRESRRHSRIRRRSRERPRPTHPCFAQNCVNAQIFRSCQPIMNYELSSAYSLLFLFSFGDSAYPVRKERRVQQADICAFQYADIAEAAAAADGAMLDIRRYLF